MSLRLSFVVPMCPVIVLASLLTVGCLAQKAENVTPICAVAPNTLQAAESPGTPASFSGLESSDGSKVYIGKLISVECNGGDLRQLILGLGRISGKSFALSPRIAGKRTAMLSLQNIPVDQAMDIVVKTHNLAVLSGQNGFRVVTALEASEEKARTADWQARMAAERANIEELSVNYIYPRNGDPQALAAVLKPFLGKRTSLYPIPSAGALVVKATRLEHHLISKVFQELDPKTASNSGRGAQ